MSFHTFACVCSLQLITPTRSLVLGAENRKEMEDWCQAMKAAAAREFFDPTPPDQHDFLAGHHHWYVFRAVRPYKFSFKFH